MRALQTFSDEYLERCQGMSVEEKFDFIENFRLMHSQVKSPSKLISIKIPEASIRNIQTKS